MTSASTEISEELQRIRSILEHIPDPEIPVLSVTDLGIVRDIHVDVPLQQVHIDVTPTYSGCPAMDAIMVHIRYALLTAGYKKVIINKVLSPVWTTDWMSEAAKQKLQAYGIAPPHASAGKGFELFSKAAVVQCPLCQSYNTAMISEFGSTACKALYRCNDCSEPFDVFKCH